MPIHAIFKFLKASLVIRCDVSEGHDNERQICSAGCVESHKAHSTH